MVAWLKMKEAADRGGFLCGPPAADHDRLGVKSGSAGFFTTCPLFSLTTDIRRGEGHIRFVPIVLKKSFLGDGQNFLGPLMRLASGDVRDHIVSHKTTTDHRIGATGL
jgi:hypothetical protein